MKRKLIAFLIVCIVMLTGCGGGGRSSSDSKKLDNNSKVTKSNFRKFINIQLCSYICKFYFKFVDIDFLYDVSNINFLECGIYGFRKDRLWWRNDRIIKYLNYSYKYKNYTKELKDICFTEFGGIFFIIN